MRRSSDFDHRRSLSSAIGWAFLLAAAVAFALMLVGWLLAGRVDAQEMELDPFGEVDLPEQQDPDVEPLMRGPLHEAFAEQVNLDPQPGPIIPREPPQPIAEIPPEVKPDGENVEWIPGYWAWDEAEERFLWVSGVWRAVPREIRWVPGRWAEVDGGFQWISGYWISRNVAAEPELLPTPPASVEQGPSTEPPGDDYFWVPGCWVWRSDVYHWRSGFWQAVQPGWIWIPSRYIWTPLGCVYRPGYWDYHPVHRGVCYAPVVYHRPVYRQPGYAYRPYVALNTVSIVVHLFSRPGWSHYYFGDYYGADWRRRGFYPFTQVGVQHRVYDPLSAYYRWHGRHRGTGPLVSLRYWQDYFTHHASARPPHRYGHYRDFVKRHHDTDWHAHTRLAVRSDRVDRHRPVRHDVGRHGALKPGDHRPRSDMPPWMRLRPPADRHGRDAHQGKDGHRGRDFRGSPRADDRPVVADLLNRFRRATEQRNLRLDKPGAERLNESPRSRRSTPPDRSAPPARVLPRRTEPRKIEPRERSRPPEHRNIPRPELRDLKGRLPQTLIQRDTERAKRAERSERVKQAERAPEVDHNANRRRVEEARRRAELLQRRRTAEAQQRAERAQRDSAANLARHRAEQMREAIQKRAAERRAPEPRRGPEARRPEARRPEARRPEVRRPEVRRPEVRRPEVRRPSPQRQSPSPRKHIEPSRGRHQQRRKGR